MKRYTRTSRSTLSTTPGTILHQTSLALQRGEDGPTLFNVHNSYENLILNYMEPYDIDTDELIADYPSASTHLMDGNIYYADYGLSTGMYYYNKELWGRSRTDRR